MTIVLHIDTSARTADNTSRALTAEIVDRLDPERVIRRDLAETPLPQVDDAFVTGRVTDPELRTPEQAAALTLSDSLIAELHAADTIVIGLPVYNFGMPAALKAWIDQVARPRVTFRYTEGGPEGLLAGKTAIVAVAYGGSAPGTATDFATPHLTHVLKFLGITEVAYVTRETLDTHLPAAPRAA